MQWYYLSDGDRRGPFSANAIRGAIASGSLPAATPVWSTGMPGWSPAHSVPALAGGAPSLPMTPPPPSWSQAAAWNAGGTEAGNLITRALKTDGRFNRGEFAKIYLGAGAITFVLAILLSAVGGENSGAVMALILLAYLLCQTVVIFGAAIRRLHDLGQSGVLVLLNFVPLINAALWLCLLLAPGKPAGSTKWG